MSDYPIERWRGVIAEAYEGRRPLEDPAVRGAVEGAVAALDAGDLRVAERVAAAAPARGGGRTAGSDREGAWITHGWLQQALALFFRLRHATTMEVGPFECHDR